MNIFEIAWTGHDCFKGGWVGIPLGKPITILIGRNNSGKSRLLDLVRDACAPNLKPNTRYRFTATLERENAEWIVGRFARNEYPQVRHELAEKLATSKLSWVIAGDRPTITDLQPEPNGPLHSQHFAHNAQSIMAEIQPRVSNSSPWSGRIYRHIQADRDIRPETLSGGDEKLKDDGSGATELIRSVLHDAGQNEKLITRHLLGALNTIFERDGSFLGIQVKRKGDRWEVMLEEDKKGLVPLSRSGSGLKTVILVLLNLLVVPAAQGRPPKDMVFAFEELENNLHPALLRRLLIFIRDYVHEHHSQLFLTTHSSVVLDLFGGSTNVQFLHISHDGENSSASLTAETLSHISVLDDLGAKPSDLLQANGIIWVEGPSDRVYVNRWIELATDGNLREGIHYQCAFYGGSLLAHVQFDADSEPDGLANLFRINRNIVVMIDSDKSSKKAPLKARAQRIKDEVNMVRGKAWVTWGKEIENYLPFSVIAQVFPEAERPPSRYEQMFPSGKPSRRGKSFTEEILQRAGIDKTLLATKASAAFTKESLQAHAPLWKDVATLLEEVERWNR